MLYIWISLFYIVFSIPKIREKNVPNKKWTIKNIDRNIFCLSAHMDLRTTPPPNIYLETQLTHFLWLWRGRGICRVGEKFNLDYKEKRMSKLLISSFPAQTKIKKFFYESCFFSIYCCYSFQSNSDTKKRKQACSLFYMGIRWHLYMTEQASKVLSNLKKDYW